MPSSKTHLTDNLGAIKTKSVSQLRDAFLMSNKLQFVGSTLHFFNPRQTEVCSTFSKHPSNQIEDTDPGADRQQGNEKYR